MELTLRHTETTILEEKALIEVVKKYSKLKKDIYISFTTHIQDYGYYYWDKKNKRHTIFINPDLCKRDYFKRSKAEYDKDIQTHLLIGTIIHELRHAQQKEKLKYKYDNDQKYVCTVFIEDFSYSEYFSQREADARVYENRHINNAMQLYHSCCHK
jgi:HSP90 family molecular chaperone